MHRPRLPLVSLLVPLLPAIVALPLLVGCSQSNGRGPVLASSAGQPSYAVHYADELSSSTKAVSEAQAHAKKLSAGFGARVDELKKPNWDKVDEVIDASDRAGRSADFAGESSDVDAVRTFWDAEKGNITGRAVGSAQQKIKEGGCNVEVADGVAYAIQDGVLRGLQKRLRAHNDAFVILERYKTSLGPQNTGALEKLADDIAQASYLVHVRMVAQRERAVRLLADRSAVERTLDRYVQDEIAFQADAGRTEAEKKASQERVATASKEKADIDATGSATVGDPEQFRKQLDQLIDAATQDYDDALKALRTKVTERRRAEPPPKA